MKILVLKFGKLEEVVKSKDHQIEELVKKIKNKGLSWLLYTVLFATICWMIIKLWWAPHCAWEISQCWESFPPSKIQLAHSMLTYSLTSSPKLRHLKWLLRECCNRLSLRGLFRTSCHWRPLCSPRIWGPCCRYREADSEGGRWNRTHCTSRESLRMHGL